MDCYIPIANCQSVEEEILNALSENSLIDQVWIHPTREYYAYTDRRRYRAIADNTLEIFQHAIKQGNEFFALCNSNRMVSFITHYDKLYEYIKKHDQCGFISYSPYKTRRNPRHVCAGFGIARTEAVKEVKLDIGEYCHCISLADEMRQAGWLVSYESKDIRIKKRSE